MWVSLFLCTLAATPLGASPGGAALTPAAVPAPLAREEVARYRILYGALGQVGEMELRLRPAAPNGRIPTSGAGKGSVFGLGSFEKRVAGEYDPVARNTHRWTTTRIQDGRTVVDEVHQHLPGQLALVRHRSDRPDEAGALSRAGALLDPVGLLLRLRLAPPATRESFEVLDGRALWRVGVGPGQPGSWDGRRTLKIEGQAEPIAWNGAPDPSRSARSFVVHLSDDPVRTPLALLMPVGLGEVRVELTTLDRPRGEEALPVASAAHTVGAIIRFLASPWFAPGMTTR